MIGLMAKILIIEPHVEVRDLLAHIVARLGHEPVSSRLTDRQDLTDVDVVLLEPSASEGVETARAVRAASGAAVVCVSIFPASEDAQALDPVAYLLKPFSLADLERAVLAALESRRPAAAA